MEVQGVEIEATIPCAEGKTHPVRLRFTGWGEYEVVQNPCAEVLGEALARMATCSHALQDKSWWASTASRKQVVESLRQSGALAVPILIQALGDGDSGVRVAACRALGQIGDSQAVPALIERLGDEEQSVRAAACGALGQIGDSQAVPALIGATRDSSSEVVNAAREALQQILAKNTQG
ncbi:MAG: HEAT repeat domain-containing protein [Fimbriimonadales bacterium]|nr:MAG: hypothetical protein KatS3mg018_0406 [Fimbriimonadales bacterium]